MDVIYLDIYLFYVYELKKLNKIPKSKKKTRIKKTDMLRRTSANEMSVKSVINNLQELLLTSISGTNSCFGLFGKLFHPAFFRRTILHHFDVFVLQKIHQSVCSRTLLQKMLTDLFNDVIYTISTVTTLL